MKRYTCKHGYSLMMSHDGTVGPPENEYVLHSDHAAFVERVRGFLEMCELHANASRPGPECFEVRNMAAALLKECEDA